MLRFSTCKCTLLVTLIALLLMTTVCICSANSTIHKPSVPEFTVKLVAHPYDVPSNTTTTIDQYTGKEIVTTQPGYHVENKSIEIIIKNQPFKPYQYLNTSRYVSLYFNVRVKGHFSDDWKELYSPRDIPIRGGSFGTHHESPKQSSSEYTVLSCPANYATGEQVDFQVEAFAGFYSQVWPYMGVAYAVDVFTGEFSGWSDTQTITINWNAVTTVTMTTPPPASTQTPTATAVPTQNLPDQPVTQTNILPAIEWKDIAIATSGIVIAVLVLALVLSRKRSVRAALG